MSETLRVKCDCGVELETSWDRHEDGVLQVDQCPSCLKKAVDEAYHKGRMDEARDNINREEANA
jgi:hypothetical protein